MSLWKNKKNYSLIIIKYPPYLFQLSLKIALEKLFCFVLRFYGPVNTVKVM